MTNEEFKKYWDSDKLKFNFIIDANIFYYPFKKRSPRKIKKALKKKYKNYILIGNMTTT